MKIQSRSYNSGSISEVAGPLTCSTPSRRSLVRILAAIAGALVGRWDGRPDKGSVSELGGALTYPIIMLCVGTGIAAFLVAYVIPQVATIFVQQHAVLPLATKILIRFSACVTGHWLAFAISFAVILAGIAGALATSRGRRFYRDCDRRLAQSPQITEWIEVVMTLAMAAVIVFMMLAVLMPIFQLNQLMQ
jgi:type II secretory pathway component PulF